VNRRRGVTRLNSDVAAHGGLDRRGAALDGSRRKPQRCGVVVPFRESRPSARFGRASASIGALCENELHFATSSSGSRDDVMRRVRGRLGVCLQRSRHFSSLVFLVILAVPLLAQTNAAVPDPDSTLFEIPSRQYLFGDWGGKRSKLAEKGVTFDFFYISDLEANPSGGMQQTQAGWPRIRGTVDTGTGMGRSVLNRGICCPSLPVHRRETRRRGDGCGLQSWRHPASSFHRPEVFFLLILRDPQSLARFHCTVFR
jgi:hypothetical protein